MVSRQTLLVGSVVVLATLSMVVPATAAIGVGSADRTIATTPDSGALADATTLQATPTATNESGNASANGADMGTQMAAFMQSNAAQVEDSVDNGMWEAAFERANESQRARLAHVRVANLSERVDALRDRNRTLRQQYDDDIITYEQFVVAAAQLNGRMEALEHGVNGTARAVERAGINTTALDRLRNHARNLTGPEVAGIARGLVRGDHGPPADVPGRGPPGASASDRPDGGPPATAPGNADAADGGANATRATDGGDSGNASRGTGTNASGNGDEAGGDDSTGGTAGSDGDTNGNGNPDRGPPGLLTRDTLIR